MYSTKFICTSFSLAQGYNRYGSLCATKTQHGKPVDDCTPLTKTFFLQYQWFPLAVAGIAFIYYLPYLLFRVVNTDLQEINDLIKGKNAENVDYSKIITRFFIRKNNSTSHLHARVLLNFVVKTLYIISNVIGMIFVDSSINHDFMRYGPSWNAWTGMFFSNFIHKPACWEAGGRRCPKWKNLEKFRGKDPEHFVLSNGR